MELSIEQTTKQVGLKRTEYTGVIRYTQKVTPARKDVASSLATQMKTKPELVIVRSITPVFGHAHSRITAYVYDDEKSMNAAEHLPMRKRHQPKKAEE